MVLVKSSPGDPLVLDHTIPSLTVFSNSSDPNYKWRHYFNATQTYRLDADIPFPYGKLDFQLKEPKDQPDYSKLRFRPPLLMFLLPGLDRFKTGLLVSIFGCLFVYNLIPYLTTSVFFFLQFYRTISDIEVN